MSRRMALSREEAVRLKKHLLRLEELLTQGERSLSYAHLARHYLAHLSSRLGSRSEAKPLVGKLLSLLEPGSRKFTNNKEELRNTISLLWRLYRLDELEYRAFVQHEIPQGEGQ